MLLSNYIAGVMGSFRRDGPAAVGTDSKFSIAVHPHDLRIRKLRKLRKPGKGLPLEKIEATIHEFNARVEAGKIDEEKGVLGVDDAYMLTLYTILCQISTGRIDHDNLNKCRSIVQASPEFEGAVGDLTYILEKAAELEGENLSNNSVVKFLHKKKISVRRILADKNKSEERKRAEIDALVSDLTVSLDSGAGLFSQDLLAKFISDVKVLTRASLLREEEEIPAPTSSKLPLLLIEDEKRDDVRGPQLDENSAALLSEFEAAKSRGIDSLRQFRLGVLGLVESTFKRELVAQIDSEMSKSLSEAEREETERLGSELMEGIDEIMRSNDSKKFHDAFGRFQNFCRRTPARPCDSFFRGLSRAHVVLLNNSLEKINRVNVKLVGLEGFKELDRIVGLLSPLKTQEIGFRRNVLSRATGKMHEIFNHALSELGAPEIVGSPQLMTGLQGLANMGVRFRNSASYISDLERVIRVVADADVGTDAQEAEKNLEKGLSHYLAQVKSLMEDEGAIRKALDKLINDPNTSQKSIQDFLGPLEQAGWHGTAAEIVAQHKNRLQMILKQFEVFGGILTNLAQYKPEEIQGLINDINLRYPRLAAATEKLRAEVVAQLGARVSRGSLRAGSP